MGMEELGKFRRKMGRTAFEAQYQQQPVPEDGITKRAWLAIYLDELLGLPNSRYDDQVDSTSQALDWVQQRFASEFLPAGVVQKKAYWSEASKGESPCLNWDSSNRGECGYMTEMCRLC